MSEPVFDGKIVAGTCFVCGGRLLADLDGEALVCERCGITLKVERKTEAPPAPQAQPTAPAPAPAAETENLTLATEPDADVVALAKALAAAPDASIAARDMRALTLADHATQAAIFDEVSALADHAIARRKFRRAVPLCTIVHTVHPTAESALALLLAKAGCADISEIPASDVELTTLAEYPAFLKLADADTRAAFLSKVRLQAERKEEAEEARMEEERLAFVQTERGRLRVLLPFAYGALAAAVLLFTAILAFALLGVRFALARILFWFVVGCSIAAAILYILVTIVVSRINGAEDADTDHRILPLVLVFTVSLIIGAALVLSLSGIGAGYDGRTGDFYYNDLGGEVRVSAPALETDTLTIPADLHGKPVVSLGNFSGGTFEVVNIPESVTEVCDFAFAGCKRLQSATLPTGLTTLGGGVFSGCSALTSVNIPAGVPAIGGHTFSDCTALTAVTFSSDPQVKNIGKNAFENCTSLVDFSFPNSVKTIERDAFLGATALSHIVGGTDLVTIGTQAFARCTSLVTATFAEGLSIVGERAFAGCTALTSVRLPQSVTHLEREAFAGCAALTECTLPSGSTTIGQDVFLGCDRLVLDIPETAADQFTYTAFDDGVVITAYLGNNSIVSVPAAIDGKRVYGVRGKYDDTLKQAIGGFVGKTGITYVILPNSMTLIGEYAFYGCTDLSLVRFGTALSEIGGHAFAGCTALTSLSLEDAPNLLTINDYAFQHCNALSDISFGENSSLSTIGKYAFDACSALKRLDLPNSLTTLLHGAFRNCTGLSVVNFGTGNLVLYPDLFYNCGRIRTIHIPANVSIEPQQQGGEGPYYSAFHGWSDQQIINIYSPEPEGFPGLGNCNAKVFWNLKQN